MTVKQLIEKLKQFDNNLEVWISDGYNFHFYKGQYDIQLFEDDDGSFVVDIGVGGCEVG